MTETPYADGILADDLVAGEIRAELARQRVSHADLAAQLGVSRAYLSRRLAGDTPLSVPDLATIAGILGVPVTQFTAAIDEQATK